jgi:ActR/RegA family two-component response regulator
MSVEPTILLVDDDADLRETMIDLIGLRGLGICIGVGSLAEVQTHAARTHRCSLAILDINLGEGAPSGVDVYRWLVQLGFAGRIVFLTGYGADDPRVQEAIRIGLRILTKPISVSVLHSLTVGDHRNA